MSTWVDISRTTVSCLTSLVSSVYTRGFQPIGIYTHPPPPTPSPHAWGQKVIHSVTTEARVTPEPQWRHRITGSRIGMISPECCIAMRVDIHCVPSGCISPECRIATS
ncbi:hypothetical protein JB92DRAFT_3119502 [Gautieria morchelliformis]|nr:hypothetical protein JB92DRAFT_3119502 [Gautieria morchelliformis]